MADEFAGFDATAQADLVRKGEVTPAELVEAAITRIEALEGDLNALVTRQFERALEEARCAELPDGPFRGVPLLLKDLGAHLEGDPLFCGMGLLKRLQWREQSETYFAGKLRRAGFISLGRTNTPELGLSVTTEPTAFGPTHNPWKLSHSSGGSSGGAAASVAAGTVPVAHASDGGGSIRIPASHCGLVGLKPSRGRNSFGPDLGQRWDGFSVEGFVTRTVRDSAVMLDIVSGLMPGDPYTAPALPGPLRDEVGADPGALRIGMMLAGPRKTELHEDVRGAVADAGKLLASLGHTVEESHPKALDDPDGVKGFVCIVSSSIASALDTWSEKTGEVITAKDVEPLTWGIAEIGRTYPAAQYVNMVNFNHAHSRRLAAWWESGFDLLLTPTCCEPPPELGYFAPTPENPLRGFARALPFTAFTGPFNVSGQPAISLPLHWNGDGLPVGMQLVAAYGREDLLIRIAAQLEQAHPWASRVPPVFAGS